MVNETLSRAITSSSEAAAARSGPSCCHLVRLGLELVGERVEAGRRVARAVGDRLRQEPVREPRVSGEQWAVQVRANGTADAATFVAALAVVPEAGDDTAQRVRLLIQARAAGVVLEAGKRATLAGLQLALEQ